MFNKSEQKLKTYATFLGIFSTVIAVILFLILFSLLGQSVVSAILGFIVAFIVWFLSMITAWTIHSFADLVEANKELVEINKRTTYTLTAIHEKLELFTPQSETSESPTVS